MRQSAIPKDEESSDADLAIEQAWLEEADRRYQRHLAGESQSVPAADAIARVRARLREGRRG